MSAFGVAMVCIGAPPINQTATLDAAHRPSSIHQVIREDMRPVALQTTLSHLVTLYQGIYQKQYGNSRHARTHTHTCGSKIIHHSLDIDPTCSDGVASSVHSEAAMESSTCLDEALSNDRADKTAPVHGPTRVGTASIPADWESPCPPSDQLLPPLAWFHKSDVKDLTKNCLSKGVRQIRCRMRSPTPTDLSFYLPASQKSNPTACEKKTPTN